MCILHYMQINPCKENRNPITMVVQVSRRDESILTRMVIESNNVKVVQRLL